MANGRIIPEAARPLAPFFLVSLVVINALAVNSITNERDGQALDLLLVSDVSPVEFVLGKLAGVLWVTPWARGAGARVRRDLRTVGPLLLAIGALTALSAVTWVAALKYAGITVTTVLSSTSPLFAIPIGLVVFGERVSARAVGGILLAVAGIVLLSL